MDSLHTLGFYVSAALSVTGGLAVAFLRSRGNRGIALAVAGLGVGGLYLSLSAGFAGIVAVVCFAGCAVLLARPDYRSIETGVGSRWRQLGAAGAAALLVALAYAAFRGHFLAGWTGYAPLVETTTVGKLLLAHDALATEAVGALVLAALVGATAVWRVRDRNR